MSQILEEKKNNGSIIMANALLSYFSSSTFSKSNENCESIFFSKQFRIILFSLDNTHLFSININDLEWE